MTATDRRGDRQRAILDYIRSYIRRHHIAPTTREIGDACGISSKSIVQDHLKDLEVQGYIGRYEGVARGIYLKDKA